MSGIRNISQGSIVQVDDYDIFVGNGKSPMYVKPWIDQHCEKNPWFVKVDTNWALDWFNQHGFSSIITDFDDALSVLALGSPKEQSGSLSHYSGQDIVRIQALNQQAQRLYGLLHARFICQPAGLNKMAELIRKGIYGKCPRTLCEGCPVIPVGTTLTMRRHSVKLFCPCCRDIYKSPSYPVIDGAYFGPAFAHIFIMDHAAEFKIYEDRFRPFVQKAFGFNIRRPPEFRKLPHHTNIHRSDRLEDSSA